MERDISTQDKTLIQHAWADEKIEENLHQNMKPKQIQPNPKTKTRCVFNMTPTFNESPKMWPIYSTRNEKELVVHKDCTVAWQV